MIEIIKKRIELVKKLLNRCKLKEVKVQYYARINELKELKKKMEE